MRIRTLTLSPHPSCKPGPVTTLTASGSLDRSGRLALDYELRGDLRSIRLAPPSAHPQRREELWRHTCFEAFVQRGDAAGYLEFNFSPAGDWAGYEFADYRIGRRNFESPAISSAVAATNPARLLLRARVDLGALRAPGTPTADLARWRLNITAVIESLDGSSSYWAAHHSPASPDFHDRAAFRVAFTD